VCVKDTISIPEADGPQSPGLGFPTCLQASCKPGWHNAIECVVLVTPIACLHRDCLKQQYGDVTWGVRAQL
jgi:hypothetical protein